MYTFNLKDALKVSLREKSTTNDKKRKASNMLCDDTNNPEETSDLENDTSKKRKVTPELDNDANKKPKVTPALDDKKEDKPSTGKSKGRTSDDDVGAAGRLNGRVCQCLLSNMFIPRASDVHELICCFCVPCLSLRRELQQCQCS